MKINWQQSFRVFCWCSKCQSCAMEAPLLAIKSSHWVSRRLGELHQSLPGPAECCLTKQFGVPLLLLTIKSTALMNSMSNALWRTCVHFQNSMHIIKCTWAYESTVWQLYHDNTYPHSAAIVTLVWGFLGLPQVQVTSLPSGIWVRPVISHRKGQCFSEADRLELGLELKR